MRPPGGEKLWALPIRLRSTCTSRPSTACTSDRPLGQGQHQHRVAASPRVASWISASVAQDRHHVHRLGRGARQFGIHAAGVADVADQPVQPAHVLGDDRQQPRAAAPGPRSARSVSMALRMELSGFLISCATSAANRSVASMRAHSAAALSGSACASSPTSSRAAQQRRRHGAGPAAAPPACPVRARQAQDRPGDGQRQVPGQRDRQHQRQSRTAPGWTCGRPAGCRPPRAPPGSAARCRPCGGCAAPARRPSPAAGSPRCGGCRAASRGRRSAPVRRSSSFTSGCQSAPAAADWSPRTGPAPCAAAPTAAVVDATDGAQHGAAVGGRRQRLGDHGARPRPPAPGCRRSPGRRGRRAWPGRSASAPSGGAAAGGPGRAPAAGCRGRSRATALSPSAPA